MSTDALSGSQPKLTLDGVIERMVRWIVVDDQAFHLVEVPEFRDLMLYLAQGRIKDTDLPHRNKLEVLANAMYRLEKDKIDKEMEASRGYISLTSDLWSDIQIHSFMAVTAHFINEHGILRDHLIAFRKLDGHHTGANIAKDLYKVLQESGIANKPGYITLDNASNNNSAMVLLEARLKPHGRIFDSEKNRIRCFPHILNLAVQAIIKALGHSATQYEMYMENNNQAIPSDVQLYLEALKSQPVDACRDSVAACRSSGTRRDLFEKIIKTGNAQGQFKLPDGTVIQLPESQLLWDVVTRWGSTLLMTDRYQVLYPAVVTFAFQMRHEAIIPVLDHSQFKVLQDITLVLCVAQNAQELLSAEKTPTLALTLPLYETILWTWEKFAVDIPPLAHAIECGVAKLQEYRGLIQEVPVHTLAMFINPCIKLTWIVGYRSRSEVQEAEEIVIAERTRPLPTSAYSMLSARRATHVQSSGYFWVLTAGVNFRPGSNSPNLNPTGGAPTPLLPPFTSQAHSPAHESSWPSPFEVEQRNQQIVREEYDLYLAEALVEGEKMGSLDLVQYWMNHQYTYPNLYQIAMNVLPAQASSVSLERVFSSSKMTITPERSQLSASNVEHLQVLKHALRRRRRDLLNGIQVDADDDLDFVSHLFTGITLKDSPKGTEGDGMDG